MCLYNKPYSVRHLLEGRNKTIVGYKVLTNNMISPYLHHPFVQGENRSNSRKTQASLRYERIDKGIHVFTTLKAAQEEISNLRKEPCYLHKIKYKILQVICKKSDLIGASLGFGIDEAVFTKIYISKNEWAKHE